MGRSVNYEPKTALFLANVCALTYYQYKCGENNPQYDGAITPPFGYKQIASFKAPEINIRRNKEADSLTSQLYWSMLDPGQLSLSDVKALDNIVKPIDKSFFGFALEAIDGSKYGVIALRGTQEPYEWLMDVLFAQVPLPLIWFRDKKLELAKAHFGFLFLYSFLMKQIAKIADQSNKIQRWYITGHSLGGALAILAALHLAAKVFPMIGQKGKVQMYNFAAPKVGNSIFCNAYNYFVPFSFRVVNQADIVPTIPPKSILRWEYQHVGKPEQEWCYLNQTGDVGENHSLENNYIPALQNWAGVSNQKNFPAGDAQRQSWGYRKN